ncbi:MAG: hypothetical protein BYD32DRAFT_404018 [Podila humilis]|nr:MAG: hypothetical protein BYD32DRAFT_404018 [Podila humilis]
MIESPAVDTMYVPYAKKWVVCIFLFFKVSVFQDFVLSDTNPTLEKVHGPTASVGED